MLLNVKEILILMFIIHMNFPQTFSFLIPPKWMVTNKSYKKRLVPAIVPFATPSHRVTIQHDGKEHILNVPEDMSILDAALEAEIDVPHDCKLGVCLTCPSRIVSGKLDQSGTTLDDSVVDQGFALMCMSFPRSEVVVKSIDEDELVSAQFSR